MAGKRQWQSGCSPWINQCRVSEGVCAEGKEMRRGRGKEREGGRKKKDAYTIPHRPRRHAPKPNLIQHKKLAGLPKPRIEQMRGIRKPRGSTIRRIPLPKKRLQHIHDPPQEMRPTAYRRRAHRFQQRALRDFYFQQVVEAVVDDAVGVIDREEVVARGHLEHRFREVEVYGGGALRACAGPVED